MSTQNRSKSCISRNSQRTEQIFARQISTQAKLAPDSKIVALSQLIAQWNSTVTSNLNHMQTCHSTWRAEIRQHENGNDESKEITWVTSAEVTQMITTVAIRNRPALYLQPIAEFKNAQKNQNFKGSRNRSWKQLRSSRLLMGSSRPCSEIQTLDPGQISWSNRSMFQQHVGQRSGDPCDGEKGQENGGGRRWKL